MNVRHATTPTSGRHGERGVTMLEMVIVIGVLTFLVFGITTFGVTMSFKQTMSQASNEAARAAAVAPRTSAVARAETAVDRVLEGHGAACNDGTGMTCTFVIGPCEVGDGDCMEVELRYDLRSKPRVPSVPAVSAALPDELVSRVVVQVNS